MAARASPFELPTTASFASRPALSVVAMLALLACAFGPKSHSTGIASSALLARHQVSATTATALSPTRTTFFTPASFNVADASKLLTLPPKTGQSLIAAFSMPGSTRSLPYCCLPVVLSTVSSRAMRLLTSFQSFGSFNATSAGGLSFAAATATLP